MNQWVARGCCFFTSRRNRLRFFKKDLFFFMGNVLSSSKLTEDGEDFLPISSEEIIQKYLQHIFMKQTGSKSDSVQNTKSLPKSTVQKSVASKQPNKGSKAKGPPPQKYKINAITRDNFDIGSKKQNITQIGELNLKYVLKCIDGLYKNRFLFITTHPDGQIFGSGDAKLYGLTLQIEGVGLASKHAQLKYDGFKSFNVLDFGSQNGTWMNIPSKGTQIRDGEKYAIGNHIVTFQQSERVNEIQQICIVYHIEYLSQNLQYNGIRTISDLLTAQYNGFEGFPFQKKQIEKLEKIVKEIKNWYNEDKKYKKLNMIFNNEPLKDFSMEIGWETHYIASDPEFIFTHKDYLATVQKGRLLPKDRVFTKIKEGQDFPLSLHSQIKLGDLSFEMTRFNSGSGVDIGYRPTMEDGLIIEEDIGGSQWKLISLFAVFDGHGGPECMEYIKDNLVKKIRQWTPLLDEAGDINQMIKVLMNKTFYQLDYQFYKKDPELAETCGATGMVVMIIEKRVYSFHIGDCKSYLFRNNILYQMNIDHLPGRGDERIRIEGAGGFVQYDRLMGKCMLSRCMGQFQYKNVEDYENQMKGKLKSYLSCLPELISFDIQVENDDFMLISTDGIFESMSVSQVTDFIKERYDKLEMEENPNKIINSIMQNCKITNPECDNMAAILIIIRKGQAK